MNSIVERLRQHALPDPQDEREVMHAPLLREAADLIEQQAARIAELEAAFEQVNRNRESVDALKNQLATLRQKIEDAPVVAWRYKMIPPGWTYSDQEPNRDFFGDAWNRIQVSALIVKPDETK